MEKERKGLFERILDFWKDKISMGESDRIGFWYEKKDREDHFAEMGVVATLTQKEIKQTFWEKTAENNEEKTATEKDLEKWKGIFSEEEKEKKTGIVPISEEEGTERTEEKGMFIGDIFRMKTEGEPKEMEWGKTFFWDVSETEEEKRNIIPVLMDKAEEKTPEKEEQQEENTEPVWREEKKTEPMEDIESLMRQITKRLWEEREGCSRRLR